MTNEQRIIQFVVSRLKQATTGVLALQILSKLTYELVVLDKLLSSLPSYDRDVALDVICGNDIVPETKEEGVTE